MTWVGRFSAVSPMQFPLVDPYTKRSLPLSRGRDGYQFGTVTALVDHPQPFFEIVRRCGLPVEKSLHTVAAQFAQDVQFLLAVHTLRDDA